MLILSIFTCKWLVEITYIVLYFKCKPHKMVKHTQTIRRQKPTNCLSVFDHFVGLALKGLRLTHDPFRQLTHSGQIQFYTP